MSFVKVLSALVANEPMQSLYDTDKAELSSLPAQAKFMPL